MNTLLLATFWQNALAFLFVGVSLLLIFLILLQKNRGAGLSGAFGGVGGYSAFGTKTGDFLTWVTVGLVALFFLLGVASVYAFRPAGTAEIMGEQIAPVSPPPVSVPAQPPLRPVAGTPITIPAGGAPAGGATTPASPVPPPAAAGTTSPPPVQGSDPPKSP